jgi:hypothetical protein
MNFHMERVNMLSGLDSKMINLNFQTSFVYQEDENNPDDRSKMRNCAVYVVN